MYSSYTGVAIEGTMFTTYRQNCASIQTYNADTEKLQTHVPCRPEQPLPTTATTLNQTADVTSR